MKHPFSHKHPPQRRSQMRIGFLGIGNMGRAMASNLLRAGHEVTVYNRSRSAAEALAAEGASVADYPAGAAGQQIVITMLANDQAVESVVLGQRGALEGMQSDGLHVSMSTISPALSQRLAAAHRERGQQYLAAPVFGRPEAAAAAKLFIVAAGTKEAQAKAKPLFEALGQRTFTVGERPEDANYIKLFGNFLITCVLESLGEVFTLARKAEIDPSTVFEVLSGTLFGAPAYNTYGPRIIEEKFSPAGFKLPLGLKDVRLLLQAAEELSTPMPFANIVRDRFLSAMASGYGDLDWSALTLAIAQSAGLPQMAEKIRSDAAD
jgi:3-hydroxyisobutyrate dehydrogenase-like beta-hydroxyacid dehydrogenase